jgi:hypothetical protein
VKGHDSINRIQGINQLNPLNLTDDSFEINEGIDWQLMRILIALFYALYLVRYGKMDIYECAVEKR